MSPRTRTGPEAPPHRRPPATPGRNALTRPVLDLLMSESARDKVNMPLKNNVCYPNRCQGQSG